MERFYKFRFQLFKYSVEFVMVVLLAGAAIFRYQNEMSVLWYWIFTIFCGLVLVIWILAYHKDYHEPINNFCEKHHIIKEELERDFESAEKVSFYIRLGGRFLFCIEEGGEAVIAARSEITKLEYHTEARQRGVSKYLCIYEKTGGMTKIPCSRKKCKRLQKQILGNQ